MDGMGMGMMKGGGFMRGRFGVVVVVVGGVRVGAGVGNQRSLPQGQLELEIKRRLWDCDRG